MSSLFVHQKIEDFKTQNSGWNSKQWTVAACFLRQLFNISKWQLEHVTTDVTCPNNESLTVKRISLSQLAMLQMNVLLVKNRFANLNASRQTVISLQLLWKILFVRRNTCWHMTNGQSTDSGTVDFFMKQISNNLAMGHAVLNTHTHILNSLHFGSGMSVRKLTLCHSWVGVSTN